MRHYYAVYRLRPGGPAELAGTAADLAALHQLRKELGICTIARTGSGGLFVGSDLHGDRYVSCKVPRRYVVGEDRE